MIHDITEQKYENYWPDDGECSEKLKAKKVNN
jgi:hypothetical protein